LVRRAELEEELVQSSGLVAFIVASCLIVDRFQLLRLQSVNIGVCFRVNEIGCTGDISVLGLFVGFKGVEVRPPKNCERS